MSNPHASSQSTLTISKWVLVLLASISAITPLAIDMYLPAMQAIAQDLNSNIAIVQNSLSSYLLGFAIAMLFCGPIADVLGRRPMAIFGLLGFSLASFALSHVTTIEGFLFVRTCQAVAGGAAAIVAPGIIRHIYGEHAAKGLSYVSMIMMVAPMVAPSLGSLLLEISDWRAIFSFQAAYGTIILIAAIFCLPEIPKREKNASWPVLFFASYKTVFSTASIRPYLMAGICASFAFFSYLTAIPFVYMDVFGVSAQFFGILFGINVIGLFFANFINTRFVVKLGSKQMLAYATITAMLSGFGLLLFNWFGLGIYYTVVTTVVLMASLIIISVNADALILMKFPEHTGTASAAIGTLRFGIGSLSGPVLAITFTGTPVPFSALMFSAVFVIAVCQLYARSTNSDVEG